MKKKKILRVIAILGVAGILIGGGIGLYMFNMPHRDVQSTDADYNLTALEVVLEYLSDQDAANQKYLSPDGESKILEITGVVAIYQKILADKRLSYLKAHKVKPV